MKEEVEYFAPAFTFFNHIWKCYSFKIERGKKVEVDGEEPSLENPLNMNIHNLEVDIPSPSFFFAIFLSRPLLCPSLSFLNFLVQHGL